MNSNIYLNQIKIKIRNGLWMLIWEFFCFIVAQPWESFCFLCFDTDESCQFYWGYLRPNWIRWQANNRCWWIGTGGKGFLTCHRLFLFGFGRIESLLNKSDSSRFFVVIKWLTCYQWADHTRDATEYIQDTVGVSEFIRTDYVSNVRSS